MLKRYSALDSNYLPGSYPLDDKISVRFKEFNNLNLQQLACWPNTLSETENFFRKEFDTKMEMVPYKVLKLKSFENAKKI